MVQINNQFWNSKVYKNQTNQNVLEIIMYGIIGDDAYWDEITAKQFSDELQNNKDVSTIEVRINSDGGSVFAGQAIYSMLKRHQAYVIVYIDGLAASIASLIAMAGDKVIMPKNAMMMIHDPWSGVMGNASAMRKEADTLDQIKNSIIQAYKDKTGLDENEISQIMTAESWFTAHEAVEKGFADELEESKLLVASLNKNILSINGQNLDISKFNKFNSDWFKHEDKIPESQNNSENNKRERAHTMDLFALCQKLGLDYNALLAQGMPDEQIQALALNKIKVAEEPVNGQKAEKQRTDDILNLGKTYNAMDRAIEFVQNGKSTAEFKDELLKAQTSSNPTNAKRTTEGIGMTQEEAQSFKFVNLINAMADPTDRAAQKAAAFEFEACEAAAAKYGAKNKGTVIPIEALITPLIPKKAANIDTTIGSSLIKTDLMTSSFIELLRNKSVILKLARILTGLVGPIDIPRQSGSTRGYWLGEDEEATGSNPTFDEVSLDLKTVSANAYITRKMRKQSSLDIESFVRLDLAISVALALDSSAFYGSGSNNKQPTGLKNLTGLNAVTFTGVNPTFAELVQMETEISADNADVDSMAYIFNARTRGHLKTAQKFPDNTDGGGTIWEPGKTVNGYSTDVTNQIENGDIFFGNFGDFILGMWGGLEILVDPYTNSKKGGTVITTFQDVDMAARHAASFCYGKKP